MYVWVDVSCLPHNERPTGGMEAISVASKGLAVAEAVAFSDSEMVQTEAQVRVLLQLVAVVQGQRYFLFFKRPSQHHGKNTTPLEIRVRRMVLHSPQ